MSSYDPETISTIAHHAMERAIAAKLAYRQEYGGGHEILNGLATRIGLIQRSLKPRLYNPHLLVFAGDHGLAVDGVVDGLPSTTNLVQKLIGGEFALSVLAHVHDVDVSVVDAGISDQMEGHPKLLRRKIAHGTRSSVMSHAMTTDQAQAAIRAGMEIVDGLPSNLVCISGIGQGASLSAALLIAHLAPGDLHALSAPEPQQAGTVEHQLQIRSKIKVALKRHRELKDPIDVLAALGGFEIAMMVGALLLGASKRQLMVVDGIAAYAALMIAHKISPNVSDYCVFARSHAGENLSYALNLFERTSLPWVQQFGLDGTGAVLSIPLLMCASALLASTPEGHEEGSTRPADVSEFIVT